MNDVWPALGVVDRAALGVEEEDAGAAGGLAGLDDSDERARLGGGQRAATYAEPAANVSCPSVPPSLCGRHCASVLPRQPAKISCA